ILHGGCRAYSHHQGEPTFQLVARTLPLSPRPASSCFSTCTKIVQLLFLPVRTNIHKVTAALYRFPKPRSKSAKKSTPLAKIGWGDAPKSCKAAQENPPCKKLFLLFNPISSIFSKTTSPSIATISPLAKPVSPSNAAPSSKAVSSAAASKPPSSATPHPPAFR